MRVSRELGLEGLVAKRLSSAYHPGVRSNDWRKIKNFQRCDFVVGGWLPGKGGGIEALYVGHREPGAAGLVFDGTVELGVGCTGGGSARPSLFWRPTIRRSSGGRSRRGRAG